MDSGIIRFNHFISKASYCKLQDIFIFEDHYALQRGFDSPSEEPFTDHDITICEMNDLSGIEISYELNYNNDFLIPGVLNLSKYYCNLFKKEIINKGLFTKDLQTGFAKRIRYQLIEYKDIFTKADYLGADLKKSLINQIEILEEIIEGDLQNIIPNVKFKLQFNWKKVDVIYFFYLLRVNNVIHNILDADLGRIIDSVCEYFEIPDENYAEIKMSRKILNDFKNNTSKTTKKANNRLKELFTNQDFFNH